MEGISKAMVRVEGVSPLLMHNPQAVDVNNEWAQKIKTITSKHHSKKTDSDHAKLKEYEFYSGLYFDDNIGPYVPDSHIEGAIRNAARMTKKGLAVLSGMSVEQEKIKLEYDGPVAMAELYKNKKFVDSRVVKLGGSSSMIRTRPRFDKWALEFEVMSIDDIVSISDVNEFLILAGRTKGIGDFRPKFGRFVVADFVEF